MHHAHHLLLLSLLSTLSSAFLFSLPSSSSSSSSSLQQHLSSYTHTHSHTQTHTQPRRRRPFSPLAAAVEEEGGGSTVADDERAAAAKRLQEELEKERRAEENKKAMGKLKEELKTEKRNKVGTAVASALAAVAVFFYQHTHPVEAVTLLRQMQNESPLIQQVVANGRPTVVDFYAEWCENCKEMAPVLRSVEAKYKDRVNFVVINGDDRSDAASDMVERFRVDGIPHLALITKEGEVKTALIGKVPKQVIEADIDSLLTGTTLPYEGYDAFEEEDHFVRF